MPTAKLRPLELSDLDGIMAWVNEPEIVGNFQHFNRIISREEEEQYLERLLASETDRVYAIETESGEYLGNIGLHQIHWPSRNARFAIIIGRKEEWGKGYAQNAIEQLLKIAFEEMKLHKVWGLVFQENIKAQHVYVDKCGFKVEGVLREEYLHQRVYHNMLRIAMLENEYSEKSERGEK